MMLAAGASGTGTAGAPRGRLEINTEMVDFPVVFKARRERGVNVFPIFAIWIDTIGIPTGPTGPRDELRIVPH